MQKSTESRYTIIPRTLIFLRRDGRVLLLKGAPKKKLWANLYNGIGGHIEKGEDIYTAAHRELAEETGLNADKLYLCGTIMIDTGDEPGIGIFVFSAENPTGELKNSHEGLLEWIDPNELSSLDVVEDLPILLSRVLEWKPGDAPFSAVYRTGSTQEGLEISFSA